MITTISLNTGKVICNSHIIYSFHSFKALPGFLFWAVKKNGCVVSTATALKLYWTLRFWYWNIETSWGRVGGGVQVAWQFRRGGGRGDHQSLSVPLFNDERPHVVARLVVVLGVGSVTVRELQIKSQWWSPVALRGLADIINRDTKNTGCAERHI